MKKVKKQEQSKVKQIPLGVRTRSAPVAVKTLTGVPGRGITGARKYPCLPVLAPHYIRLVLFDNSDLTYGKKYIPGYCVLCDANRRRPRLRRPPTTPPRRRQEVAKMMKPTSDNPKIKSHAGETRTQQTRHKRSEKHKAKQTVQDDGKRHETKPRQKQSPRAANNRDNKTEGGFRRRKEPLLRCVMNCFLHRRLHY